MDAIIPLGDGGRDAVLVELYITDDCVAATTKTTHNMEHGMRGASAFMVSLFTLSAFAGEVAAGKFEALQEKPRLFVLTDLANEPDDEESLVRLLAYANEFNIEGIAATTSCHLRQNPREDILRHTIAAYGEVWTNLNVHAHGYPTVDRLSAVATSGQPRFGVEGVGEPSPGSRLLAKSIISDDPRPLWVSIWGGDLRADGAHAVLDLSAIPEGSSGSVHVILRVRDSGTPTLFAYRRVIVEVDMAPLSS